MNPNNNNYILIDSALNGNLNDVKKAIEQGADINYELNAALINSVKGNHVHIVEYFLSQGMLLNFNNNELIKVAIIGNKENNLEMIKLLLKNGVEISNNEDYILDRVIAYHNIEVFKYLTINKINIASKKNNLLRLSAKYGALEILKYLINIEADIHYNNEYPLFSACYYGRLEVIKYLVEAGSNINVKHIEKNKVNSVLISTIDGRNENTVLIINYLIEKNIIISNEDKDLMKACLFCNNLNIVKIIIENGGEEHFLKGLLQTVNKKYIIDSIRDEYDQ